MRHIAAGRPHRLEHEIDEYRHSAWPATILRITTMRAVFGLVVLCVLSGCVTSADAPSFGSAPIPEARSDVAVLYVFRGYAQPILNTSYLDVDGKQAAGLDNQGFTWLYLKPGMAHGVLLPLRAFARQELGGA